MPTLVPESAEWLATGPWQDKTHPRSDFAQRGRVRVQLKDPVTGDPTVEDILTRAPPCAGQLEPRPPASPVAPRACACAPAKTARRERCVAWCAGKELLKKLAAMIPNLKSRKEKPKASVPPSKDALPPGYAGHPMLQPPRHPRTSR